MSLVGNSLLVAGDSSAIPGVLQLLDKEGIDIQNNPDIYIKEYAHFGVDDARDLRERAALLARGGNRRVFVVVTPLMTAEAQNALLKTLEEPPGNALFFLIVPAPEALLPTLRSRTQRLALQGSKPETGMDPKIFLASAPAKRLEMLKPLLEKDDDDRRDVASIITFLSLLERMLESVPRDHMNNDGLTAVYRARKYMLDKGSLLRPLLEQVALLVPIMKA